MLGDPSIHPVKAEAHAFSGSEVVKSAIKSGILNPGTREFRRERLARAGSNLTRTVGAAVPVKARTPAVARRFLIRAARESGIREPRFESFRVRFPRTANAPELANVRADRSHRWIHMAIGNGRVANKIVDGAIAAIIVTMEGRQIVHVRRVHRR